MQRSDLFIRTVLNFRYCYLNRICVNIIFFEVFIVLIRVRQFRFTSYQKNCSSRSDQMLRTVRTVLLMSKIESRKLLANELVFPIAIVRIDYLKKELIIKMLLSEIGETISQWEIFSDFNQIIVQRNSIRNRIENFDYNRSPFNPNVMLLLAQWKFVWLKSTCSVGKFKLSIDWQCEFYWKTIRLRIGFCCTIIWLQSENISHWVGITNKIRNPRKGTIKEVQRENMQLFIKIQRIRCGRRTHLLTWFSNIWVVDTCRNESERDEL